MTGQVLEFGPSRKTRAACRPAVVISGAVGGLGKAFAVECASRGWDLFLTDLRQEPLEMLAEGLRNAYGVRVMVQTCDLTDSASRSALFESIGARGLRFWMLINVAGLDYEGPFYEQTRQQIRTILRLNIEGTLEMTHALLEHRDPMAAFRIINVASLAAFYPMPVKATYAASKRFLLDFSLALREEVRELGATVTVLCPAGLPTTRECIDAIEAQGWMGQVTTQNTGSVAARTLDSALKGRALVIPGLLNCLLQTLGGLLPPAWIAALINSRWRSARQKRNVPVSWQEAVY
jgi:short-subunit dehydrogenase